MPDFAKALRSLTPPFSLAEQLRFLKGDRERPSAVSLLPPGENRSNALGSHYFLHSSYAEDHFHGKVRLSRFY
jgi:hypothetical protein